MDKPKNIQAYALARVGHAYIFATSGQDCTPARREERARAKPAYAANIKKYCPVLSGKQSTCAGCKYQGKQAFDCRGLTYQACRAAGIAISSIGASSQWKGDYWAEKGAIEQMPKEKLCLVFRETASASPMGHTGVYLGDGTAVDARGHATGVTRQAVGAYPWTHYAIPRGLYDTLPGAPDQPPTETVLPTLRKGAKGEYVVWMQSLLLEAGHLLPKYGADGHFGAETEAAVKAFQADHVLKVDGIVGPVTWAALLGEVEDEPEDALYTVTIRGLTEVEAAALVNAWPDATKVVE